MLGSDAIQIRTAIKLAEDGFVVAQATMIYAKQSMADLDYEQTLVAVRTAEKTARTALERLQRARVILEAPPQSDRSNG